MILEIKEKIKSLDKKEKFIPIGNFKFPVRPIKALLKLLNSKEKIKCNILHEGQILKIVWGDNRGYINFKCEYYNYEHTDLFKTLGD
jgi:hypothetical protein